MRSIVDAEKMNGDKNDKKKHDYGYQMVRKRCKCCKECCKVLVDCREGVKDGANMPWK